MEKWGRIVETKIIIYGTGKTADFFLENCNVVVIGVSDSFNAGGISWIYGEEI